MLLKRIIPCLDVDKGRVVKGVRYVDHVDAGDPVEVAQLYDEQEADEITFLTSTPSPLPEEEYKGAKFTVPVIERGLNPLRRRVPLPIFMLPPSRPWALIHSLNCTMPLIGRSSFATAIPCLCSSSLKMSFLPRI